MFIQCTPRSAHSAPAFSGSTTSKYRLSGVKLYIPFLNYNIIKQFYLIFVISTKVITRLERHTIFTMSSLMWLLMSPFPCWFDFPSELYVSAGALSEISSTYLYIPSWQSRVCCKCDQFLILTFNQNVPAESEPWTHRPEEHFFSVGTVIRILRSNGGTVVPAYSLFSLTTIISRSRLRKLDQPS